MKPLVIDFAPRPPTTARLRWIAGVAGLLATLVGATAWVLTSPVEASHMAQGKPQPDLPDGEAAQAIDAAIRELNLPWPQLLDALAASFGPQHDAVLLRAEADISRATVRLAGEARSQGAVQALPARLRGAPAIATATLLGQETVENAAWPVRFTLELRVREAP
ncbi:MAG: hypothetical protein HXY29_08715 [Rhodocyclaceae bacterium]|jgi:hypothetical protein|nr:hypothetical protein [Rhodocyclaceae bacterium]